MCSLRGQTRLVNGTWRIPLPPSETSERYWRHPVVETYGQSTPPQVFTTAARKEAAKVENHCRGRAKAFANRISKSKVVIASRASDMVFHGPFRLLFRICGDVSRCMLTDSPKALQAEAAGAACESSSDQRVPDTNNTDGCPARA